MKAAAAAAASRSSARTDDIDQVSLLRLYALRAGYLLLVVGLGLSIWPGVIHHDQPWTITQGAVH